jgi:sarcosine oxidase
VRCVGIDRWTPPHSFGSSHGESRITRVAVGEGRDYIPLAKRSHEIWDGLERRGCRLRGRTGVLYLAGDRFGGHRHGAADFMGETLASAEAAGVAIERLGAGDLRTRYPQFAVTDDTFGYLEPDAGFVRPEACIEAQLAEAAKAGAVLRFNEPVTAMSPSGDGVLAETSAATYRARRAVVAMGAWIPDFVGGPFRQDFRVLRQVLYWFKTERGDLWDQRSAPTFLWFHGAAATDVFYGFPMVEGGRGGVKVATEQYVDAADPDAVAREVTQAEIEAMYDAHVRGRLVGVERECMGAEACLYTYNHAPGREGRFMIGAHPSIDGVTVVSACSGHGFKHSAGLGDAIARQLLGEAAFCDLGVFAP